MNAEPGGNAGYQAEYMRTAKADTALVKVPGDPKSYDDATLDSLLTLADVMATGYHAAVSAEVKPGDTAVVFGDGADAVLECVGSAQSIETAVRVGRPGSVVGRVGVPHDAHIDVDALFWRNIGLKGGPASVAAYDRGVLLPAVLSGMVAPGRVFTARFDLAHIQDAYTAMDERRAIKSLVDISEI